MFGRRVKKLRTELGLTQAELAAKCDLTRVFINQIENGHVKSIMASTAIVLAKALGVSVEDLFC